MGESIKSRFKPQYPKKYVGDPNNIICRSSWERKFCNWCDTRSDVLRWGSEEIAIKYVSPKDGKIHRYFPDFIVEIRENDGRVKKYIIEVKPYKQTQEPKKPTRQTKSYLYECMTYAINQAKWKACDDFCKDNGVEFKIITENELGFNTYGGRSKNISSRQKKQAPRKHR